MAFTTERITDMICRRLEEYGYDYGGHMSPKLYPIYLKVAGGQSGLDADEPGTADSAGGDERLPLYL